MIPSSGHFEVISLSSQGSESQVCVMPTPLNLSVGKKSYLLL